MIHSSIKAALVGGTTSAALDLLYAFVAYAPLDVSPMTILQSIATGWLGNAAYANGASAATLGLISHFVILWSAAAIYSITGNRWRALVRHPWRFGALFGLAIFVIMNFVVVPLSHAAVTPPTGWLLVGSLFAHTCLVGVPIAFAARRYGRGV